MLTKEAWNAFLKTLEEPPPNTVFVLATTEAHKVMATIADRCQRFDFQRPSLEQIAEVLQPGRRRRGDRDRGRRGGDDRPLGLRQLPRRARHARPARRLRRRALGRASTPCSSCSAPPTPTCSSRRSTRSPPRTRRRSCAAVERMARSGRDPTQFARDLLAHLRHLLVAQTIGEVPDSFVVTATDADRLQAQAPRGRRGDPGAHDRRAGRGADRGPRGRRRPPRGRGRAAEGGAARPRPSRRGAAAPDRAAGATRAAGSGRGHLSPPDRSPRGSRRSRRRSGDRRRAAGRMRSPMPSAPLQPAAESAEAGRPPPATRSGADLDLDKLIRLWPAVLDQLRQSGSAMLAALFEGARPVALDARSRCCGSGSPPTATFNKRKAEAAEQRERFAEALRDDRRRAPAAGLRAARRRGDAPEAAARSDGARRGRAAGEAEERVQRGGGRADGRGGGPGGFDMNALMKQAQQMQARDDEGAGAARRTRWSRPAPAAAWSR